MITLKVLGNVVALGATANVVPLASGWGGNTSQGATAVYLINTSTGFANVTIANVFSNGTLNSNVGIVPVASGQTLIIEKAASDLLYSANTLVLAVPVARAPSA